MKNKYGFALLLITGIVMFWGCKSTGTVTEVPPEAPPPQVASQSLDAAIARADKERTLASDFQSPSYFPAEWGAAEADYSSIRPDRTTVAGVQDAERRYSAAADTYHGLFQKTLPLYAADTEDEGWKIRDELLAAGIEDYVPGYLDIADQAALDAESSYLAEDYYKAKADALEALDRYRSLKTGLEAYQLREEIEQRNLAGFDQASLNRADETLLAAADAYEGEAVKDALSKIGESKAIYDSVLKAASAQSPSQ
jgi:hypothetical protein